MYKGLAAALLIIGIILIIYGVNASNSFDSGVSRVFTGAPSDRTIWFLISGVVAASVGLCGLFRGKNSNNGTMSGSRPTARDVFHR